MKLLISKSKIVKVPDQEYIIVGESYGGYIARCVIQNQVERVLGAAFKCPVIIPIRENRTVEKHKVLKNDEKFVEKLSKE
ncbi:hypothetical protein SAMN05518872_11520 [Psychrobacillus sp. OK032]|nr:hypothetical protein SAMN05518872_11520 [Psychrobacillus sp. OK032]